MSLLLTQSRRYLGRHRWQLWLSVVGIALGVAVVVAVELVNTSARRAFTLATEAVSGRATHQVTAADGWLPDELYRRLRGELGLRPAAPVVEAAATSPAAPGRVLTLLGVDPFAEGELRPYLAGLAGGREAEGRGGGGPSGGFDLEAFLTLPGAAVLATGTARELGLAAGDELPLVVAGQPRTVRLVGTLTGSDELSRRALGDLVVVDLATAQELLGRAAGLSRVDLILPPGAAGEAALARLSEALPAGVRVMPAGARGGALDEMTRAFRLNLTALALLALLCGAFLIYNTATFSVVQRRSLLGLLRALGVTRREIFALVLGEAAVVGLLGTAAGLLLGVLLSRGLIGLVTRTINDLYFSLSVGRVAVDPGVLVRGALLGVGAAVVAALAPAWEATAAPPRAVWSRSLLEEKRRRGVPRAALAGVAGAAGGGALLALPGGGLAAAFGGLFAVLVGCALMAPAAAVAFARAVRPLAGRAFGLLGRMAAGGIVTSLSRTAVAIATLMIAVSVMIGVSLMISSFRATVVDWLEITLRADVYASLPGGGGANRLDDAFVERARSLAGVARLNTLSRLTVETAGGEAELQAIDLDERSRGAFDFAAGDPDAAWQAFLGGEAAIVSEPFASRTGLEVGDLLPLATDRGHRVLPIAGVYYDYSSDRGVVTLSRAGFERFWEPRGASALALFAAPGTDPDHLVAALRKLAAEEGRALVVRSNRALKEASLVIFDRTFRITGVLRLLAGVVALVGMLAALMALQLERGREIGVLRAQGLTPRQVWGLVGGETGLMGLLTGLLSIPVGLVMAAIMIYVINRRSFGWTIDLEVTPGALVAALGLALGAALLAGVYPAWRMARTPPAAALREE